MKAREISNLRPPPAVECETRNTRLFSQRSRRDEIRICNHLSNYKSAIRFEDAAKLTKCRFGSWHLAQNSYEKSGVKRAVLIWQILSVCQYSLHIAKSSNSSSTFQRIEHRFLNIDSIERTARDERAGDGQRMNSISRSDLEHALTGAWGKES